MERKIDTRIMQINPTMAQRWLNERNNHNRKLYESTVESYARDMKRGLWALNNQGIGFDEEGNLLDGQHRLMAIVWSGVTVPMVVVKGLPKNFYDGHQTQETIDQGKPRGTGDILTLTQGIDNGNIRAAIIRGVIALCAGQVNRKFSVGLISEALKIYQEEIEEVIKNRSQVKGLVFAPALSSFVFAAKCYQDKIIEFEQQYFSGENLSQGNPVLTFRNFMLQRDTAFGGTAYRLRVKYQALNCLMRYVLGEPLKRLVNSTAGRDFFANKQKKTLSQIQELLRY
jgi:hypothetical protein